MFPNFRDLFYVYACYVKICDSTAWNSIFFNSLKTLYSNDLTWVLIGQIRAYKLSSYLFRIIAKWHNVRVSLSKKIIIFLSKVGIYVEIKNKSCFHVDHKKYIQPSNKAHIISLVTLFEHSYIFCYQLYNRLS